MRFNINGMRCLQEQDGAMSGERRNKCPPAGSLLSHSEGNAFSRKTFGDQQSASSDQLSANSYQPRAISFQPTAFKLDGKN
jgi:hypothetical protein